MIEELYVQRGRTYLLINLHRTLDRYWFYRIVQAHSTDESTDVERYCSQSNYEKAWQAAFAGTIRAIQIAENIENERINVERRKTEGH